MRRCMAISNTDADQHRLASRRPARQKVRSRQASRPVSVDFERKVSKFMSDDAQKPSTARASAAEKRVDARISKTIRFSGPEWELVEKAAAEREIPASEYVRLVAVEAAEGKTAALSAEIVETIRRIYRSTYILSTLKRDEMMREGREAEMEETIKAARRSQSRLERRTLK